MTEELMVNGLRVLLVLAAMAAVADVWWQTGAFERRVAAEAKRAHHLRSLTEVDPPSIEAIRAAWLDEQRARLHHLLDHPSGDAESQRTSPAGWAALEPWEWGGKSGRLGRWPLVTRRLLLQPCGLTRADAGWEDHLASAVTWQDGADRIVPVRSWNPSLAAPGDALRLTVTWRGSGQCVGDVSLQWWDNPHRQGEVGCAFDPRLSGSECAREALLLVLKIGFEEAGLRWIAGRPVRRRQGGPPLPVWEHLGMRLQPGSALHAWAAGEAATEVVYAMSAEEWFAQKPLRVR